MIDSPAGERGASLLVFVLVLTGVVAGLGIAGERSGIVMAAVGLLVMLHVGRPLVARVAGVPELTLENWLGTDAREWVRPIFVSVLAMPAAVVLVGLLGQWIPLEVAITAAGAFLLLCAVLVSRSDVLSVRLGAIGAEFALLVAGAAIGYWLITAMG